MFGQVAGSLGSHVVTDSSLVAAMPPHVTFQQAATMPTVFMTADMAFSHAMSVPPGTHTLIHATAGMILCSPFVTLKGSLFIGDFCADDVACVSLVAAHPHASCLHLDLHTHGDASYDLSAWLHSMCATSLRMLVTVIAYQCTHLCSLCA